MWKREETSSFLQGNLWITTLKPEVSDKFPHDPKLYPVFSTSWNENYNFLYCICRWKVVLFNTTNAPRKDIALKRSERLQFSSTIQWDTSLNRDVAFAGEGLTNLAPCSAPVAFEKGRLFIVPHLLWHGILVYKLSSEWPPRISTGLDVKKL